MEKIKIDLNIRLVWANQCVYQNQTAVGLVKLVNQNRQVKPWINDKIAQKIKQKNKIYRNYWKTRNIKLLEH